MLARAAHAFSWRGHELQYHRTLFMTKETSLRSTVLQILACWIPNLQNIGRKGYFLRLLFLLFPCFVRPTRPPNPLLHGCLHKCECIKSRRSPHRLSPVCFLKGGELEALGGQLVVVSVRPTWYPDNSDSKHWLCPPGALSCGLRAISPPPSRPTSPNISHFTCNPC